MSSVIFLDSQSGSSLEVVSTFLQSGLQKQKSLQLFNEDNDNESPKGTRCSDENRFHLPVIPCNM